MKEQHSGKVMDSVVDQSSRISSSSLDRRRFTERVEDCWWRGDREDGGLVLPLV